MVKSTIYSDFETTMDFVKLHDNCLALGLRLFIVLLSKPLYLWYLRDQVVRSPALLKKA